MLLTSTIRRKVAVIFGLVVAMLLVILVAGIYQGYAFRNAINDLHFSINAGAQRGELLTSIVKLSQPLLLGAGPAGAQTQYLEWRNSLEKAREEIRQYHDQLEKIPLTTISRDQRPASKDFLAQIEWGLVLLEEMENGLKDEKTQAATASMMLHHLAYLQMTAAQMPNAKSSLQGMLEDARSTYRWGVVLTIVAAIVVAILLFGLIYCAIDWFVIPIRKLSEGARQVANGNLNHRVVLTGHDEMTQLATMMNRMTERFCDQRQELARKVQEQSQQLVRSERMVGAGFLAAGVAHEINNPMHSIAFAAESISDYVSDAETAHYTSNRATIAEYAELIKRESRRCSEITEKLLEFARGKEGPPSRTNVTETVSQVIGIVRTLRRFPKHTIVFDPKRPFHIMACADEIKQVVLNLVVNAMESMEGSGTLTIEMEDNLEEIIISFRDTGCGMSPQVKKNLFEPFFTEKKAGRGTGLGLSISHRIVTEHGGRIEADSPGPGLGSTFRLCFPRATTEQALSSAA